MDGSVWGPGPIAVTIVGDYDESYNQTIQSASRGTTYWTLSADRTATLRASEGRTVRRKLDWQIHGVADTDPIKDLIATLAAASFISLGCMYCYRVIPGPDSSHWQTEAVHVREAIYFEIVNNITICFSGRFHA
jgi:hypothetical protein